jgi:hypothetical protein
MAQEGNQPIHIDEATNKRLRWMIHKRVLLVMVSACLYLVICLWFKSFSSQVVTYFAQTLDKGTINFASIMGIREVRGHEVQYSLR